MARLSVSYMLPLEGLSRAMFRANLNNLIEAAQIEMGWLDIGLMEDNELNFSDLDMALNELTILKPAFKATLLKSVIAMVTIDQQISSKETELLRAVSDTLSYSPLCLYR